MGEGIRTSAEEKFLGYLGKENFGEGDHRLRLMRTDLPLELAAYGVNRRRLFAEAVSHRVGGVTHG